MTNDIISLVGTILGIFKWIIYFTMAVYILKQEDNMKRLKMITVIGGIWIIFFLSEGKLNFLHYMPEWNFMTIQIIIMAWLGFMGIDLMISHNTMILLLFVYFGALLINSSLFWFLGVMAYIILFYSFVSGTVKKLTGEEEQEQTETFAEKLPIAD